MGHTINLISGIHNYVKGGSTINGTPEVPNSYTHCMMKIGCAMGLLWTNVEDSLCYLSEH